MHRLIRGEKWQKLSALESEYSCAFAQLKTEIDTNGIDAVDVQAMVRLEQQQRRMQRVLSLGLKETGEKLAVIEDARKRLKISSQVASTLARAC
jgi:hypothetical protein